MKYLGCCLQVNLLPTNLWTFEEPPINHAFGRYIQEQNERINEKPVFMPKDREHTLLFSITGKKHSWKVGCKIKSNSALQA